MEPVCADYGMGSVLGVCLCAAAQICSSWENSSLVQRKLIINGDNDNKTSTHIYTRPCALRLFALGVQPKGESSGGGQLLLFIASCLQTEVNHSGRIPGPEGHQPGCSWATGLEPDITARFQTFQARYFSQTAPERLRVELELPSE